MATSTTTPSIFSLTVQAFFVASLDPTASLPHTGECITRRGAQNTQKAITPAPRNEDSQALDRPERPDSRRIMSLLHSR